MSPEQFDAEANGFMAENWMTPSDVVRMNWPKTLELWETTKADVEAVTETFLAPVATVVMDVSYYTAMLSAYMVWSEVDEVYEVLKFVASVIGTALYDVLYGVVFVVAFTYYMGEWVVEGAVDILDSDFMYWAIPLLALAELFIEF